MSKGLFIFVKISLMIVVLLAFGCEDRVIIGNSAGNEHGLLADGHNSSGHVNDRVRKSASTTINVGQLEASSTTNEIIGFTRNRPVTMNDNAIWTSGRDTESLTFSSQINIPVTVWIVKGPVLIPKPGEIALAGEITG
jgi:hypothetical protein